MSNATIRFTDGQLENSLNGALSEFSALGTIPDWVSGYIDKNEVDPSEVTDDPLALQEKMWRYLDKRGAQIKTGFDQNELDTGKYDEILYSAYDHALKSRSGGDPLGDLLANDGIGGWDFTVDSFETIEDQGVLSASIRAGGAIDYVYEMGERLRIFDLAESLVLDWASGRVDVAEGPAAAKLYRYWKLLDDRSSPEERAMLYRRVLNKGGMATLDSAVINEGFPTVWGALMGELAEYIDKSEKIDSGRTDISPVSPKPIYQAMRELQYNLSEYCTGMAFMQTQEIYAQLTDAFDLLKDPDVIASFGGVRRRNMWTVISELSKRSFGSTMPVAPLVRVAVDGNRIFQIASDFDEATFSPDDLVELVSMGESYIINSSLIGESSPASRHSAEEAAEFDDFESDFADFEDF